MIFSLILTFFAVLLTGIGQTLLKIGSTQQCNKKNSVMAVYLNLPTLLAYGLFLFITILSVIAMKEIPLKILTSITSLGLVVVVGLSWGLLNEKVTKRMVIGILITFLGVMTFNLSI